MRAGFRHACDRVQRMDAPMQLLCGYLVPHVIDARAGMAESPWTPPFSCHHGGALILTVARSPVRWPLESVPALSHQLE